MTHNKDTSVCIWIMTTPFPHCILCYCSEQRTQYKDTYVRIWIMKTQMSRLLPTLLFEPPWPSIKIQVYTSELWCHIMYFLSINSLMISNMYACIIKTKLKTRQYNAIIKKDKNNKWCNSHEKIFEIYLFILNLFLFWTHLVSVKVWIL